MHAKLTLLLSYRLKYIAYFTATSADTWIQITGNDVPDQLNIDGVIMYACL